MPLSARPPVVVGIDGSESSQVALSWAADEAALRGLPLRVIHAWQVPLPPVAMGPAVMHPGEEQLEQAAQSILDRAVDDLEKSHPRAEITSDLVSGPPATVMIEASEDATMLVVGKGHLEGIAAFFLGSTSMQVVTHAECPVAIAIEPEADVEPGPDAGRVVVGIDGSEISVGAAQEAFEAASLLNAGVTLLHVWNPSEYDVAGLATGSALNWEDAHQGELRGMAETVAGLQEKYPDVNVEQRLAHGKPGKVLADHSRSAKLIVVGSRGHGGFTKLLLGSTSHTVVHRSQCTVLIVRPRKT